MVEARLEAMALGSAAAGAEFKVRLKIGGKVVRAVALGRDGPRLHQKRRRTAMKQWVSGDSGCGGAPGGAAAVAGQKKRAATPRGQGDSAGGGFAHLHRAGARAAGGGGADAGLDLEPRGPAGAAGHRCQGRSGCTTWSRSW